MTEPAYTHNGKNISAEAFYAIACDPRRSVAVEACAGAGKTWILVSRMVRALLDGATKPHEILAITFTKKAAGEMRERFYEWLEQFAQADDETLGKELVSRGFKVKNGLKPNEYERKQLSNLYAQVLANGRPVQIKTFHSWFAALLRTAPMATLQQLGLPLNYELLEDDSRAKALVWRRFYAALLTQPDLRADFECVVLAHGRFQTDKALQGALDKRTEFLLADAQGVVDASVRHFTVQFPEFADLVLPAEALQTSASKALLLAAAKVLGRASAVTFSAKGVELESALNEANEAGVLLSLLTDKGKPRKFGEKIVGIAIVREAQELVLKIADASTQHDAWDYQQRMARLARLLLAEFAALKRERGWVDMNDVERAAQTMLSDEVLSGWVQERLDANIRHLMIDEFQDTNPLQWHALSSWLSGYAGAAQAPSVFIVGDPKQSIYRFRRAEPQVFIAAQSFMRGALGGDVLACDHTRRSSKAVIATVNSVMGAAQDADGYEGFRLHTSASGDEGRVLRLPPVLRPEKSQAREVLEWRDSLTTPREVTEETLRTLEARQAAAWIQGLLGPTLGASRTSLPLEGESLFLGRRSEENLLASDVMVLSRKRASLLPLQNELRALQIPAQIGEKTELIDCCEVLDIVALLDVLVSPQHDLSLARALRSPLFNLSDDALVQIVLAKSDARQSWYETLLKEELITPALIGLGTTLNRYKVLVDTLPPHDALQAIYDQGDVLARFGAAAPAASRAAVLSNLRALLTAALQVNGGRYATPYAFVRALKAGGLQAPAAANLDAVRLLTIHGAKGLEAHAVLLLDTDTAQRNSESMSVLIDWPGEALAPHKFVFLISESKPPACAVNALAIEQAARQREELNALYVAMTRAKNTLAVSSIEPFREAPDSWWQRLQGLADIQVIPALVKTDEQAESESFALPELPDMPEWLKSVRSRPRPEAELDSVTACIGKAMHRLLEVNNASKLVVARVAREFGLSPEQATQAEAMAHRIRDGAAAWAWDASVVQWQGNEVELTHQGDTFRLDRLVQRRDVGHEGHWWVLDYKSAVNPQLQEDLVIKMKTYLAAMETIYPGQTVKAAFLTSDGQVVMVD